MEDYWELVGNAVMEEQDSTWRYLYGVYTEPHVESMWSLRGTHGKSVGSVKYSKYIKSHSFVPIVNISTLYSLAFLCCSLNSNDIMLDLVT